jgi:hypothetical protein
VGVPGPNLPPSFREFSSVTTVPGELSLLACGSVTCAAAGAVGPAYVWHQFPWHFRVKITGHVLGGGMCRSKFLCVPWNGTYSRVMESGAAQWLQEQRIRSVELPDILPVLPMVSCFSVDTERPLLLTGYVTQWMPFGILWSFFFWGSWSLLGYRNVNNLLSCPLLED